MKYYLILVAVLLIIFIGCGGDQSKDQVNKPNIIIILADDFGKSFLSFPKRVWPCQEASLP